MTAAMTAQASGERSGQSKAVRSSAPARVRAADVLLIVWFAVLTGFAYALPRLFQRVASIRSPARAGT
jgi:hypothetical protein